MAQRGGGGKFSTGRTGTVRAIRLAASSIPRFQPRRCGEGVGEGLRVRRQEEARCWER